MGIGGRRRLLALALVLAAVTSGCGSTEPNPPPSPTDPAGHVFDPNRVIEVAIRMSEADWETLRNQNRTWLDFAAAPNRQCLAHPIEKPFTDFPATVTVDGVPRERVAVRKKGFIGSLDFEKPALRLKFDAYEPDQTLHGLKRLSLSNSKQDPTYLRQCLAFQIFEKGGIPAPRCTFAHVTMNDRDLGVYIAIEPIDKAFLRRHFVDESGDLWDGLFSDFRRDWTLSFAKKTNEPDDPANADRSALDQVTSILDQTPDGSLFAKLDEVFDVDRFLTFWATEVVMQHWDGYSNQTNNYLVYRNPKDKRFVMLPWGMDQMTVQDPYQVPPPPPSVYAHGALSRRLYQSPATQPLYLARLRKVLDEQWRETELLAEVERSRAVVMPALVRSYGDVTSIEAAIEGLRTFIHNRRAVVLGDLAAGPRVWDLPPKKEPCVDLVGQMDASFSTSYGTLGLDDFANGTAAMTGDVRGRQVFTQQGGATAGLDTNPNASPRWPVVHLHVMGTDGVFYQMWISIDPQYFVPGATVSLDYGQAWGYVGFWNPFTETWTNGGSVANGQVHLSAAGQTDGSPVSGSISGWVVEW